MAPLFYWTLSLTLFEIEENSLVYNTIQARIASETVCSHNPMTGDQNRDRIRAHCSAYGPG